MAENRPLDVPSGLTCEGTGRKRVIGKDLHVLFEACCGAEAQSFISGRWWPSSKPSCLHWGPAAAFGEARAAHRRGSKLESADTSTVVRTPNTRSLEFTRLLPVPYPDRNIRLLAKILTRRLPRPGVGWMWPPARCIARSVPRRSAGPPRVLLRLNVRVHLLWRHLRQVLPPQLAGGVPKEPPAHVPAPHLPAAVGIEIPVGAVVPAALQTPLAPAAVDPLGVTVPKREFCTVSLTM